MADDGRLSAAELAAIVGLHERQVRKLAERGIVVRDGRGRYDASAAVLAYCTHLREVAAGRGARADDGPDLSRERALLAREQRDGQSMRNAQQRGELVVVEQAEAVLFQIFRAARDSWMNWPSRVAPLIAADLGGPVDRLTEVLTAHVHAHLADLGEPDAEFDRSG